MYQLTPKTNQAAARQNRPIIIGVFACLYLSLLIVAMIISGPSLGLYLLFALLAAVFILPDRDWLGLALIILLTMIFERYFTLQGLVIDQTVYKFYLLDIVICLTFLALIIKNKLRLSAAVKSPVFDWSEKLLALWLALVGLYLIRGIFDINADFDLTFSSFKNYFFYPLLYFFVVYAVNNSQKLKNAIQLILLGAIGIIGFIFIGAIRGAGLWTEFTPLSTAGARYLAGTHAFYLALALVMILPLLFHQRLRSLALTLIIIGFWALGIAGSLMRHLWLAGAAGLASILILLERDLKKTYLSFLAKAGLFLIAAAVLIALAANLLYFQGSADKVYQDFSTLASRLATVVDLNSDSSAVWRQNAWSGAAKIWSANPLFGIGFGHTMLLDNGDSQGLEEIRNIHNSPLAIAVQMGFVGLLAWLAFLLSVLISAVKNAYRHEDLKPYCLGLIAAVIIYLAACLFQPYLETNMMGIWFWLLLGLLRTASIFTKQTYENPANQ